MKDECFEVGPRFRISMESYVFTPLEESYLSSKKLCMIEFFLVISTGTYLVNVLYDYKNSKIMRRCFADEIEFSIMDIE